MKKLLITTLIFVLLLSTVLISACGKKEGGTEDDATSSSSQQTASESSKPVRVTATNNPDKSSASSEPDESSDPSDSSTGGGIYVEGEPYTVEKANPTGNELADAVIFFINSIDTIDYENYEKKNQTILLAEQEYAKLDAQTKTLVSNYNSLQEAKQAYLAFKTDYDIKYFKAKYATLPAESALTANDAVLVSTLRDLFNSFSEDNKSKLGNKSEIETKLTSYFNTLKNSGKLNHTLIVDDCSFSGNTIASGSDGFFTLNSHIGHEAIENDANIFNRNLQQALSLEGDKDIPAIISFTAVISGKITIHCYRTDILKLYDGNVTIGEKTEGVSATLDNDAYKDDYCTQSFSVSAGSYQISFIEGEVYIFAIEFTVV